MKEPYGVFDLVLIAACTARSIFSRETEDQTFCVIEDGEQNADCEMPHEGF